MYSVGIQHAFQRVPYQGAYLVYSEGRFELK